VKNFGLSIKISAMWRDLQAGAQGIVCFEMFLIPSSECHSAIVTVIVIVIVI
jgi:hypothetical protein